MLKQGSIVRARIPDPQGGNEKTRPLLVTTPTNEIRAEQPLVAVAITGRFSDPLANDEVPLPYHPAGTATTGLRKPCVAKCSWLVELNVADVIEVKGFVGSERLITVLSVIAARNSDTKQQ